MVWAAITHDGKTPLVFVETGVQIGQYVYREMLQDRLIPWAEEHFGEEYWCFQQDSASAYDTQIFLG